MSSKLTIDQKKKIKNAIYEEADAFGYASSSRNDSGNFIDGLVDDPNIGGILGQYMQKERIRTYVKDGILNAYTKEQVKRILNAISPVDTIEQYYGDQAEIIQKCKGKDAGLFVLRSKYGKIFVISGGTVLKWETALRKALEIIARQPNLIIGGKTPDICLQLAGSEHNITDGDKKHIVDALSAIGVKARFCLAK